MQKEIGTPSVAEASCLLAAGEESRLLEEKRIFKNQSGAVTLAVAESKNQYNPTHGEIHIIGSGPGDISFLTCNCLLYTSPSPRDKRQSRMPSSA